MIIRDYGLPVRETAEQRKNRAFNEQKAQMCKKFFDAHPNLSDNKQIAVYAARFKATSLKALAEALKKI